MHVHVAFPVDIPIGRGVNVSDKGRTRVPLRRDTHTLIVPAPSTTVYSVALKPTVIPVEYYDTLTCCQGQSYTFANYTSIY